MILDLHPGIRFRTLTIGRERAPLLVIDQFVADPERLVRKAAMRRFVPCGRFFPGIRTPAPPSYQHLIETRLGPVLAECFGFAATSFRFPTCHYSLVTTPPVQLEPLQRIPHVDSVEPEGLAAVHYLFKDDLGGTAFYRHRSTGYEYVDASRRQRYFDVLLAELAGPDCPPAQYIDGDTALFQQIAREEGVFNRMLVYRRNSLHSASLGACFVPDPNPRTGRLSINCFIDPMRR
ncbi:MAG: hypothetical protein DIU71_04015 [Proteobacteria bacterium]|nr:MAG: hypothetical protein DIU71_04015 [Pseudomonadota bacterium]